MASIIVRRIDEQHVPGKRLGRHVRHDPRSRNYRAEMASAIKSVLHTGSGLPLNQADVGSCTAEATTAALNCTPGQPVRAQSDAYALYTRETADEGQPWIQGDPASQDPGGTGLAVCKSAVELGWITSYTHCFGADDALKALVLRPVICGVNWYSTFDTPDENGIVSIGSGASIRGGHEICATEIVADRELIGFWQSWGGWGLRSTGRFYMTFATCERLLSEDGDVTVPVP